jgi:pimeloyl-ACP methyl ester carboxylesterase
MNKLIVGAFFACHFFAGLVQAQEPADPIIAIENYIDSRFEAPENSTEELLVELEAAGIDTATKLESAIRSRRTSYPDASDWVGSYSVHGVDCYHVDYSSRFLMYVPKDFDPEKTYSLVVVGHGGNSSMSAERAFRVAKQYIEIYAPGICENMQAIVVAPASERGWGYIGYSLAFSTIAKVKRMVPIDPDQVFVTGQSMGGHLAYRLALIFPDYFGAVSPHSGGYDFVEKKSIGGLMNVPGLSVFGAREPYGINGDNKTNEKWVKQHGVNWRFIEKNGGHTIYQDELPGMSKFFTDHPRNPYLETVYFRHGGAMKFTKPWDIKGWPKHEVYSDTRPLMWNRKHWLEVQPREEGSKEVLEVYAKNLGENSFDIVSSQVRKLRVYLHPEMVDFDKPVSISVNGEEVFMARVEPDLTLMLDTVRTSDDRGKIYWAKIDLEIESDQKVTIP